MKRKAGAQVVRDKVYGRFWMGGKNRESVPMPAIRELGPECDARCEVIADAVARLVEVGRADRARDMAILLGAATTKQKLAVALKGVDALVARTAPMGAGVTFQRFGESWTSGALAKQYPDHVKKKKSSSDDEQILKQYVYPVIGPTPVRAVELEDCERVMAGVDAGRSPARRRHVAQVMSRLFKLAVYPAKVISKTPLPPGFLPKLGGDQAKQYLYPDEDAKLMACTTVPLVYRLFYGFLDREGTRFSEAKLLEWADLDLERGSVRLDRNKTDDPRSWALDRSVVEALSIWKKRRPDLTGPFTEVADEHGANRFRNVHLRDAGVERVELFERTDVRKPIRVHDLRATFVTLSLANGKTETWVQDRTGHKSTAMIAKYRRSARTVEELGLGALLPLAEAITWSEDRKATGKQGGGPIAKTPGTEGGTRTLTPFRTADFESKKRSRQVAEPRPNKAARAIADKVSEAFAGRLLDPVVRKGAQSIGQIRHDWHAIEVAGDAMAVSDASEVES